MSLENQTALITGGTRGIGRAIAKMFLTGKARVVLCGRDQSAVDRAVSELAAETGGKVAGKAADVSNYDQVRALFEFADRTFGPLDILVNNAGVGVFAPVSQLSVEDWLRVIQTNLDGAFYCSREALARFTSGTSRGGYIVNISSLAGKNPFAGGAAYNASKFAMNGFSEAMMLDERYHNVRVSYIMPGSVATGFGGHAPGAGDEWMIQPEDIAEIVRMLISMPKRTLISRVEVRPSQPKR
jgi:NAD(P)-dependent dehydrogenase (short-subunit alcohol dehydrogenase family)